MQYADYIEENHMNYTKTSNEEIEEYMDYLKEEGKKASTISRNLASIRSFYQYLVRTKKIKNDPWKVAPEANLVHIFQEYSADFS